MGKEAIQVRFHCHQRFQIIQPSAPANVTKVTIGISMDVSQVLLRSSTFCKVHSCNIGARGRGSMCLLDCRHVGVQTSQSAVVSALHTLCATALCRCALQQLVVSLVVQDLQRPQCRKSTCRRSCASMA